MSFTTSILTAEASTMLTPEQIRDAERYRRTYRKGGTLDQALRRQPELSGNETKTPPRAPCPGGDRGGSSDDSKDD